MARDQHTVEGELDAARIAVGLGRPGALADAARLQAELDEATRPGAGQAAGDELPSPATPAKKASPRRRKRQ